jgi:nicotinate-nucleotide--dimethylbenzimidazole phosphoribosyltransferase
MLPFDDIRALIADAPAPAEPKAWSHDGLGRLQELAVWLSRWRPQPRIGRPILALYAATHAVAPRAQRRATPDSVRARLELIAAGGAPVNAMAQGLGAGLEAFDLAIDRPVGDITLGPAMSERECAATMAFGMEALAKQPDILLLGDINAGGEIAAAAIALALYGGDAEAWAGADGAVVAEAAARAARDMGDSRDPLQVLRQLGGREIAAQVGAILAARSQSVPVILGGFGAAAAAAVLHRADPSTILHVLAGDCSASPGRLAVMRQLGLEPLTSLGVADLEGKGALAVLPIVKLAGDAAG